MLLLTQAGLSIIIKGWFRYIMTYCVSQSFVVSLLSKEEVTAVTNDPIELMYSYKDFTLIIATLRSRSSRTLFSLCVV